MTTTPIFIHDDHDGFFDDLYAAWEEKLFREELAEDHDDPAYRCPDTLDLFDWMESNLHLPSTAWH